jgi:hypothetical protein
MTTFTSNTTTDEETTTTFDVSTIEEIVTTDTDNYEMVNGEPTLLVQCLFQMSTLNRKSVTSIFYVAKNGK